METNKRGQWGSNFGFLMASIGAAIGLGNLWAFPYKMGKGGGFAFLVLYLILVALAGVALMLGEFAIGRKTGLGAGSAYRALGKKYGFIGTMAAFCPFVIMGFYCVLGGMVLRYCWGFLLQLILFPFQIIQGIVRQRRQHHAGQHGQHQKNRQDHRHDAFGFI